MGSNIAGFANGFIKKVNRNFEEAKMAEYEQFIHDQEREDWRADQDAIIARDTAKVTADINAAALERTNKLTDLTTADQRIIDGNLAYIKRFYPDMPEADQLAAANNPNGVGYIAEFFNDGIRWDTDTGNFETVEIKRNRAARAQAMHLKPRDVSDEMFKNSPWYDHLVGNILNGESEMSLKENGTVAYYERDPTTGAVISITPKYTNPDIPEPYEITSANDTSFNELKLTQYNKLNAIVSLPLDQFGKPLEPGILTGIVEGLTGVAVTKYADARTNGEALLPSEPFSEVFAQAFGPNHEHMEHISEEKLQMGANAISTYGNNPEGLASAEESLDTLESVYENIRVRIHITEMFPRVNLTGGTNLQTLYDIHRGIRNNPVFIAKYGLPEGADVVNAVDAAAEAEAADAVDARGGGPGPAEPAAFVDPNELYSTANGISTTEGTGGEVFYSYDDNEGQEKMRAAMQAYMAHKDEQKDRRGIGSRGSQRDLQSFIAEAFGLKRNITGTLYQRKRDNEKRDSALAQLEEQWRTSVETR